MDSNGLPAQQPNLKARHERAMAWASETETSCLWKPGPNSAYEQAKTKSWAAANHHASPRRTCPQATKHAYQTLGQHGLEFVKIQILISLLFKMKPEHLQGWPRNQKDQKLVASRNQSSPKGKSTSQSSQLANRQCQSLQRHLRRAQKKATSNWLTQARATA